MLKTAVARLLTVCALGALVAGCVAVPANGYYTDAQVYSGGPLYGPGLYAPGAYQAYPAYPAYPIYPAYPAYPVYRAYPGYPARPTMAPLRDPRYNDRRGAPERERGAWHDREQRTQRGQAQPPQPQAHERPDREQRNERYRNGAPRSDTERGARQGR